MAIKKSDLYSSIWASCDALAQGTAQTRRKNVGMSGYNTSLLTNT